MNISLKLILGSTVAVLLGIFLAVPLLYPNVDVAPDMSTGNSDFVDAKIVYAYLERQNTTQVTVDYTDEGQLITEELDEPNVRVNVVLNLNRTSEMPGPSIAQFWVYQVEFYTDKGSISNVTCHRGVFSEKPPVINQYNSSTFHATLSELMNVSSQLIEIFGGEDGGGGVSASWPIGHPVILYVPVGDQDWVSAIDESETIFIRVKELGWAIYGNSTEVVVLPEPNILSEIMLQPYHNGFLYNPTLSEKRLTEIDMFNPEPWDFS